MLRSPQEGDPQPALSPAVHCALVHLGSPVVLLLNYFRHGELKCSLIFSFFKSRGRGGRRKGAAVQHTRTRTHRWLLDPASESACCCGHRTSLRRELPAELSSCPTEVTQAIIKQTLPGSDHQLLSPPASALGASPPTTPSADPQLVRLCCPVLQRFKPPVSLLPWLFPCVSSFLKSISSLPPDSFCSRHSRST